MDVNRKYRRFSHSKSTSTWGRTHSITGQGVGGFIFAPWLSICLAGLSIACHKWVKSETCRGYVWPIIAILCSNTISAQGKLHVYNGKGNTEHLQTIMQKTARKAEHATLFNYASMAFNNHFFFKTLVRSEASLYPWSILTLLELRNDPRISLLTNTNTE